MGQGTGLGLAMVYGIVKQIGGHIRVYSEPGQGKHVQDLPAARCRGRIAGVKRRRRTERFRREGNDPAGRGRGHGAGLGERTLRGHGYTVLTASHGPSALELAERHHGGIEPLLTDVVMPQMGGRELANAVRLRFPQIRVLFMTGYTEDTIIHHGVLENGASLLQKPFTPSGMAKKVREVLDAPR